jgi:hypothetical protein
MIRFRFSYPNEMRFDVEELICIHGAQFAESAPPVGDKSYDPSPMRPDPAKTRKRETMCVDIDPKKAAQNQSGIFWSVSRNAGRLHRSRCCATRDPTNRPNLVCAAIFGMVASVSPEERTTPLGIYNFAESYRHAADRIRMSKAKPLRFDSPSPFEIFFNCAE